MSLNSWIIDAVEHYLEYGNLREQNIGALVEDMDGQIIAKPGVVDPILLSLFGDDRHFDIMEWVSDEPGRGEQTFQIGARVRGSTLRIIDAILANSNCPYTTRSDFLRDAILTTAYVASRGRLKDERAAEFARRERAFLKEISIMERNRSQRMFLLEVLSAVEDMRKTSVGDYSSEQAAFSYESVARAVEENWLHKYPGFTVAIMRECRKHMNDADIIRLDAEFPKALAVLNRETGNEDTPTDQ
jgi:hypothetical protein